MSMVLLALQLQLLPPLRRLPARLELLNPPRLLRFSLRFPKLRRKLQ
ncbi:hypothetical protein GMOD_00003882 [Pyrenophora seminiperda CCB06]|uniref:Uncharacterized protein n=1 Tax=Pyrenophora seminiperda CCB06 TaxID=1302712 RepID=A0A3M7M067_9PLEO|nr:hypothetical protein GMOD_00003882 [Pyrenophora seminiperda CCB06]